MCYKESFIKLQGVYKRSDIFWCLIIHKNEDMNKPMAVIHNIWLTAIGLFNFYNVSFSIENFLFPFQYLLFCKCRLQDERLFLQVLLTVCFSFLFLATITMQCYAYFWCVCSIFHSI